MIFSPESHNFIMITKLYITHDNNICNLCALNFENQKQSSEKNELEFLGQKFDKLARVCFYPLIY